MSHTPTATSHRIALYDRMQPLDLTMGTTACAAVLSDLFGT